MIVFLNKGRTIIGNYYTTLLTTVRKNIMEEDEKSWQV